MQYFAICSVYNDIEIRRNSSKKRNPKLREMELTSPTYLLIEANLFTGRDSPHARLLSSCNAFPSSGVQLSLYTLLPLLRGPFLTLQTSTFARTPGGAYFLLFRDTFKSAAANSLRIDNAKRISCQWGGGEPFLVGKGRGRALEARRKDEKKARTVFLLETYRAAIPFQFWGQDESKERRQPEMNINDYRHFAFMEMIGHGYSGISNLLVVYIALAWNFRRET